MAIQYKQLWIDRQKNMQLLIEKNAIIVGNNNQSKTCNVLEFYQKQAKSPFNLLDLIKMFLLIFGNAYANAIHMDIEKKFWDKYCCESYF